RTGTHDPTHAVEHFPQVVLPLPGLLAHQREVRQHELPLFVREIARIRLPCHPSCTARSSQKFRTRSSPIVDHIDSAIRATSNADLGRPSARALAFRPASRDASDSTCSIL